MLFFQPVVVNDAFAAHKAPPAEVRVAERVQEQPRWNGLMLAQSSMDQRSPFGTNAPDRNDGTPNFVAPNPPSNAPTPNDTGNGPFADPTSTKIPPQSTSSTTTVRPDAGPPPPVGGSGINPDVTRSSTAPGSTAMPGGVTTTPGGVTTTPGGVTTPGTTTTPGGVTTTPVTPGSSPASPSTPGAGGMGTGNSSGSTIAPSSATFPGASSGASNTR
jgi:hypothetical protein